MNAQFKGVWTPDFIMEMVWNGELTPTDAFLLATIHSLSKRKEGCTAKREYLAGCIGVGEGHVKKLIAKYRKMGLIVDLDFNGRTQAIKTCWDSEPKTRQPYHRGHGSSVVEDTAEISSSGSSSARGVLEDTAHMAMIIDREGDRDNTPPNLGKYDWQTFSLKEQIKLLRSVMTITGFSDVQASAMVDRLKKSAGDKLETAYRWLYADVLDGKLSANYFDFTNSGGGVVNNMPETFEQAQELMQERIEALEEKEPGFIKSKQAKVPQYDI